MRPNGDDEKPTTININNKALFSQNFDCLLALRNFLLLREEPRCKGDGGGRNWRSRCWLVCAKTFLQLYYASLLLLAGVS